MEHVVIRIIKDGAKFERWLLAEGIDDVFAAPVETFEFSDLNAFVDDCNIEDGIFIDTGNAIDFTARENEIVVGRAGRTGVAVVASAGRLRGRGEGAIFVDDGETAAVPLVVEAGGQQESSGRSSQFVEAIQNARIHEAQGGLAVARIDLRYLGIAPRMVTRCSPNGGLGTGLGDEEIQQEPGTAQFVRAKLKRACWNVPPEQIATAGKEI